MPTVSINLDVLGLTEGYHSIKMKLSDDNATKLDSNFSNVVLYEQVFGKIKTSNGLYFKTSDGKFFAEAH